MTWSRRGAPSNVVGGKHSPGEGGCSSCIFHTATARPLLAYILQSFRSHAIFMRPSRQIAFVLFISRISPRSRSLRGSVTQLHCTPNTAHRGTLYGISYQVWLILDTSGPCLPASVALQKRRTSLPTGKTEWLVKSVHCFALIATYKFTKRLFWSVAGLFASVYYLVK